MQKKVIYTHHSHYQYRPKQYTYLCAEIPDVHSPSYLLNLGWVNVPREGRGLGDHCPHDRDERFGDGCCCSGCRRRR